MRYGEGISQFDATEGNGVMGRVLRRGGNGTGRIIHDYNQELAELEEGMANYKSDIDGWSLALGEESEKVSNDPSLSVSEKQARLKRIKQTLLIIDSDWNRQVSIYEEEKSRLLRLLAGKEEAGELSNITPRDLDTTHESFFTAAEGESIYDSPEETSKYLCPKQGKARFLFAGTCGLCSVANVLRLSGADYGEGDIIDFAANTFSQRTHERLCETGHIMPGSNGGTNAYDRQEILQHFGIKSSVVALDCDNDLNPTYNNIDKIAQYVTEGRGVIVSVHAHSLWYDKKNPVNDLHAVTIVSVKMREGKVVGFFINDTGIGGTQYYSAEKVLEALSGAPMNVTDQIIR